MKRKMQNQTMSGEKAPRTVNREKTSRVAENARLRPIASAMDPQTNAPMAMPSRFAVPIQAACAGTRSHSLDNSGISTPFSVTSQASNINPRPPMRKIRPCTFHRHGRFWTTWSPVGRALVMDIWAEPSEAGQKMKQQ